MIALAATGTTPATASNSWLPSLGADATRPALAWPAALFASVASDGTAISPSFAQAAASDEPSVSVPFAIERTLIVALGSRAVGTSPGIQISPPCAVVPEAVSTTASDIFMAGPTETVVDPEQRSAIVADFGGRAIVGARLTTATGQTASEVPTGNFATRESATAHDSQLFLADVEGGPALKLDREADPVSAASWVAPVLAVPAPMAVYRQVSTTIMDGLPTRKEAASFVVVKSATDLSRNFEARLATPAGVPLIALSAPDPRENFIDPAAARNTFSLAPSDPAIAQPGAPSPPAATIGVVTVPLGVLPEAVAINADGTTLPALAAVPLAPATAPTAAPAETSILVPRAPTSDELNKGSHASRARPAIKTTALLPVGRAPRPPEMSTLADARPALRGMLTAERPAVLRPTHELPNGAFAPALGAPISLGGSAPALATAPPVLATPEPLAPPTIEARGAGLFEVATDGLGPVRIAIEAVDSQLSVRLTVERVAAVQLLIGTAERLDAALGTVGQRLDLLSVDVRGGDGGRRGPPQQAAPSPTPPPSLRVAPPRPSLADRYA